MSVKRKKKPGRKPSRSKLTPEKRQSKCNKKFLACKKKEMREALADKLHVLMVLSDGNYVWVYFDNAKPRHLYGTFYYATWLLPNFYFRTINKGVRVNLLHFERFLPKDELVFMILKGAEPVLMDACNAKNLECLGNILLEPRMIELRNNYLV
jgi:hypothetical protein